MELKNEHIEILKHTEKNGHYLGYSKEMQELCDFKMMVYVDIKSCMTGPYFKIMNDGRTLLNDISELER